MDLLDITDYEVYARQPEPIIRWRLTILEKRGQFQAKQAERIKQGVPTPSNRPPPDIDQDPT